MPSIKEAILVARSLSDMSKGKVSSLIIAQAIPLALAQLVQMLYNVVDRVYIGHMEGVGSMALTGVGLTFPIITLVSAFTNLYSTGGAPLFAIARGAKDEERAHALMGSVTTLLTVTSLVLMAVAYLVRRPVLYLFGASDASYVYADAYLVLYLLGTPFTMLATGLNGFINAQGFPKVGMLTTLLGAVINLVLDPLFIFVFGLGVQGAAIATVISQAVSCAWVLRFLTGKKALMPLRRASLRPRWPLVKEIVTLGFSGFVMMATNSLVQIACSSTLSAYGGDLYVGVMTVLNSVRDVTTMPVNGISDGAQPVLGYNYGAGEPGRVRQGIRFMTLVTLIYTFATWIVTLLFTRLIMSVFTTDAAMLDAGQEALKIYFFGYFFMSFQYSGQAVFRSLGKAKQAVFFSIFRKAIIVVPLTLLLPRLGLGVQGVFMAEPISNAVGGLACYITMWLTVYRKLKE